MIDTLSDDIKRMVALSALAIVEALQVLFIVAHIYSFIPIHWAVPVPPGLEPERESFFYIVFLLVAAVVMGCALIVLKPRLKTYAAWQALRLFIIVEAGWVLLEFFAFFKWVSYRYPFYNILPYENGRWVPWFFYGTVFLSILSKIFWPELQRFLQDRIKVWLAKPFSARQQPWAYAGMALFIILVLWPSIPSVLALNYVWDQFNQWDQHPLTALLLRVGLDYRQVLFVLVAAVAGVWIWVFCFLRRWLDSFLLAAAAVCVGIKLHLFHYGQVPVAWLYPQHLFPLPSWDWLTMQGYENAPMFDALRVRQFFSFFMGYALIVFYVFSALVLLRPWRQLTTNFRIALVFCGIGLVLSIDYVLKPKLFSYGVSAVPAVFLCSFWVGQLAQSWTSPKRRAVYALGLAAALFFLMTNRLFVSYPHWWPGALDYAQEKAFYAQDFNLKDEASLLNRVIGQDQPAAIIGSFALALLKETHHPDYWRQGPLCQSSVLGQNTVKGLRFKTKEELLKVMQQLSDYPPPYILIERKLLALPQGFYQGPMGLAVLLRYVDEHYQPVAQAGHYTLWQRK